MRLKKIFIVLLALLFLFPNAAAGAAPSTGDGVYVPILMYHEVKPQRPGKDAITPAEFESDLKFLSENGYTSITIADLIAFVYTGTPLPEKPVILSFDDGYYNNYVYVLPLLKKYQMNIVFSVIGKNTDDFTEYPSESINYAHVTWAQLAEMAESGLVEIQNHTYNLHKQTKARLGCAKCPSECAADYEKLITSDAMIFQEEMAQHELRVPTAFTYPYGKYSEDTDDILAEMGFIATVSCDYGISLITHDPDRLFRLKRICRSSGSGAAVLIERASKTIK